MKRTKDKNRKLPGSATAAAVIILLALTFTLSAPVKAQTPATITQAGWYRIGQNGTTLGGGNGSRAAAHFIVMDKTSGQHQTVEFLAYINYDKMPSLVVLNNSYYGTSGIPLPKIRILAPASTYSGSAVEVYVNPVGSNAESFLIEDNTQSSGWTAIGWQQVSTGSGDQDGVPAGFTACVLGLKDLVTGFATKSGTQASYVNGNFYTSGNILLGKTTQTNTAYKLDINGTVRANELVVNTTGADFVFDSAYRLPPLNGVAEYIKTRHHLPDIPSAREMRAGGLSVGDNQTKLLQKVEELTLYLIEQQKQIKDMKTEVDSLKRQLEVQSMLPSAAAAMRQKQEEPVPVCPDMPSTPATIRHL